MKNCHFLISQNQNKTLSNHRTVTVLIINVVSKVVVAPTDDIVDYDWKPVLLVSAATNHDGIRYVKPGDAREPQKLLSV